MKKVCIVTNYRRTVNYGAILQAYALNAYVQSQGNECKTLSYTPLKNRWSFLKENLIHPINLMLAVWNRVEGRFVKNIVRKRALVFERFREDYIPHTGECDQYTAASAAKGCDLLICGSDQIWRPGQFDHKFDDIMWLKSFPEGIKKASYAASMGITKIDEASVAYVSDALKDYSAISVREESTKEILLSIGIENVQTVLDPVFLLGKEKWLEFAEAPRDNRKYIFAYFIQPNKKIYKQIEKFANKEKLDIVYIPYMGKTFDFADYKFHGVKCPALTPQQFVGYISAAEYVITDSFHGTAFSIMLHKSAHVYITNHGTRIRNLLTLTGLEKEQGYIDKKLTGDKVAAEEWEKVERRLLSARKQSVKYLQDVLSTE